MRLFALLFVFILFNFSNSSFAGTKKVHPSDESSSYNPPNPIPAHNPSVNEHQASRSHHRVAPMTPDQFFEEAFQTLNQEEIFALYSMSLDHFDLLAVPSKDPASNSASGSGAGSGSGSGTVEPKTVPVSSVFQKKSTELIEMTDVAAAAIETPGHSQSIEFAPEDLAQIKQFGTLLVPYLKTAFSLPASFYSEAVENDTYRRRLFLKIKSKFEMKKAFRYEEMKDVLILLIEECHKTSLDHHSAFYFSYAHIMKTAMSLIAAQIHKERLVTQRPYECGELALLFKEDFQLFRFLKDHKPLETSETGLLGSDTTLAVLNHRFQFLTDTYHQHYYHTLNVIEQAALKEYYLIKSKYSVHFKPEGARRCIPYLYQLVTQYEQSLGEFQTEAGSDLSIQAFLDNQERRRTEAQDHFREEVARTPRAHLRDMRK